jgi:2-oxo-3-hexenedioate decarboxylase
MAEAEIARLARLILDAGDAASPIQPITDSAPDFGIEAAYRVAAAVTRLRIARGERRVGWKIGFTNRTIWDEYGVRAPIWGPMWDTTVRSLDPAEGAARVALGRLAEPRIEPEIALRLAALPHPDMDDEELIQCVDAVAHGVEIVQSIFPAWRFQAADTVAAFALHARYLRGPWADVVPPERADWRERLARFEVALFRDGIEIDRGVASNVLGGGPLEALRHFVRGLAEYPAGLPLRPGDIVTTGTVTRAFPVESGERWRTGLFGIPLAGLELALE